MLFTITLAFSAFIAFGTLFALFAFHRQLAEFELELRRLRIDFALREFGYTECQEGTVESTGAKYYIVH